MECDLLCLISSELLDEIVCGDNFHSRMLFCFTYLWYTIVISEHCRKKVEKA